MFHFSEYQVFCTNLHILKPQRGIEPKYIFLVQFWYFAKPKSGSRRVAHFVDFQLCFCFQEKTEYFQTLRGREIIEENSKKEKELQDVELKKLQKRAAKIGARVVMNVQQPGEQMLENESKETEKGKDQEEGEPERTEIKA